MSALASPSMTRAATQPQVTVLFSTENPPPTPTRT